MSMNTNERFTYSNMRVMNIKHKLLSLNPSMQEPDDIEVINLALVVFSIICDAHANVELGRHEIVESMLDDKEDFIYYVNDLIQQANDTNEALNEYIDKITAIKIKEVKHK